MQTDLEYIVNMVTQQVMAAMARDSTSTPQTEGLAKILVVGGGAPLPQSLCGNSVCLDMEDYCTNRNILRYDRVVITALSATQLADIAQARVSDDVTEAVFHALLNGVETLMLEEALFFRKYAGKGSTALYSLLEGYARTLQVFGVKLAARRAEPVEEPVKPPKFAAPPVQVPRGTATPNTSCLITEARALELVRAGGTVHIPADAIVTPSARDVLAQAGAEWVRD